VQNTWLATSTATSLPKAVVGSADLAANRAVGTVRLGPPHSGSTIAAMNGITHVLIEDWGWAVYTVPKTLALFLTTAVAFRFLQRRAIAQFPRLTG
jgi:hypothetical protein